MPDALKKAAVARHHRGEILKQAKMTTTEKKAAVVHLRRK